MRKYLLFEKSAAEYIIRNPKIQSGEFSMAGDFVAFLKEESTSFTLGDVFIKDTGTGLIFCGNAIDNTFLVIDLEQCRFLVDLSASDAILVLQKVFRFCLRLWNRQSFTSCERVYSDKGVVFPFSFVSKSNYRVVLHRNPENKRLERRNITDCLLAYKYDTESVSSKVNEDVDLGIFNKAGNEFTESKSEIRSFFRNKSEKSNNDSEHAIESFRLRGEREDHGFMYLPMEMQIDKLTDLQKGIVTNKDISRPIRIEGPAGSGKTAAMVLRALNMIKDAEEKGREFHVAYFTHSVSTKYSVLQYIERLIIGEPFEDYARRNIEVKTLLEWCVDYASIPIEKVIDLDASESKQLQLYLIGDAFAKNRGEVLNSYEYIMSREAFEFFSEDGEESTENIVRMLQFEFSVRIKGMAEEDIEKYYNLPTIENGLPLYKKEDKDYVFRIFKAYQEELYSQSIYDTDDIILEVMARLNGPIWRRTRGELGEDYIFADEMHLFNLNEQQAFHYLTKVGEKDVPICFALDYAQAIGDRGDVSDNYIENNYKAVPENSSKLHTVFRNSTQIMELCASITASGAMLFDSYIQPYDRLSSGMTADDEDDCDMPELYMFPSDDTMFTELDRMVNERIEKFRLRASDVAVVVFDYALFDEKKESKIGKNKVLRIDGRVQVDQDKNKDSVIWSLPEYISGLEFDSVFLVGIDLGRVPTDSCLKISQNFQRYSAYNKLYVTCSRARKHIAILGNQARGISPCLEYAIEKGTIKDKSAGANKAEF